MKFKMLSATGKRIGGFSDQMTALTVAREASTRHEAIILLGPTVVMIFAGGRELFGCMKAYAPLGFYGIQPGELPSQYEIESKIPRGLLRRVTYGEQPQAEGQ